MRTLTFILGALLPIVTLGMEGDKVLGNDIVIGRPKGEGIARSKWFKNVKCGDSYEMHEEGYIQFRLDKENEDDPGRVKTLNKEEEAPEGAPCFVGFLGSRKNKCTATIVCDQVKIPCPGKGTHLCDKGFLEVSDGLGGEIVGCGKFHLTPRKATNDGRDLYLNFAGVREDAICQVFCAEDKPKFKGLVDLPDPIELYPTKKKRKEEDCVCGLKHKDAAKEGRIVGGSDASPFEFPWMAAISFSDALNKNKMQEFSNRSSFCGATLISDRHVITAAHCFVNTGMRPADADIILHAHLLDLMTKKDHEKLSDDEKKKAIEAIPGWSEEKKSDEDEQSVRLDINTIRVHPFYQINSFDYDVAIIYLNKRVSFKRTDIARPICLPPPGKYMEYTEGTELEVAGWGLIDEKGVGGSRLLQKVTVPIVDWTKCSDQIKNLSPRHICAGIKEGGKDACQGDSGGPAIFKASEAQSQLAGIVSSGIGCARPGKPGLYTNIDSIIQWIYFHTRGGRFCKLH